MSSFAEIHLSEEEVQPKKIKISVENFHGNISQIYKSKSRQLCFKFEDDEVYEVTISCNLIRAAKVQNAHAVDQLSEITTNDALAERNKKKVSIGTSTLRS